MTTLSAMKARIADELARSDLTTNIASAITTAIEAYQSERFWFNESRTITFATVAAQEFYGVADNALIPNIYQIDSVFRYRTGETRELKRDSNDNLEDMSNGASQSGEPSSYAYFSRQIRLYPIPTDSSWSIRVLGHYKYAAPASDSEADNVWMIEAETLIRARAKYEIALHVTKDDAEATKMSAAVSEAFGRLKDRSATQSGTGEVVPTQF